MQNAAAVPEPVPVERCSHCSCSAPEKRVECHFCGHCSPLGERGVVGKDQLPACLSCLRDFDFCRGCSGFGTQYEMDPATGRNDPVPCAVCVGEGIVAYAERKECAACGKLRVGREVPPAKGEHAPWLCYGCEPGRR